MTPQRIVLFVFCLLIQPTSVWAVNVSSDSSLGVLGFTQYVSFDGDFEKDDFDWSNDDLNRWIWNMDYTLSLTNTTDVYGNATVDQTTALSFGTGYDTKSWNYGGALKYSSTPQESLRDYGPNLYLGYTFDLRKKPKNSKDEDDDEFIPWAGFKLSLTDLGYTQIFYPNFPFRKKVYTVTGSNNINQLATQVDTLFAPINILTLRASYYLYAYDQDVNNFLSNLNSPRAVNTGASQFSDTLSGFPLDTKEISVRWRPIKKTVFEQTDSETTSASDGSFVWSVKEKIMYWIFDSWQVGGSFEFITSPTLTDHEYTLSWRYIP